MGVSVSVLSVPQREAADEAGSLHGLVIENDINALSALLRNDACIDVNAKDDYASANPPFPLCVCVANILNVQGYTPLHLACDRGNVAIARLLLQHGADSRIQVRIDCRLFLSHNILTSHIVTGSR